MNFLRTIFARLTEQRPFFYGWEQRAFERRQEQTFGSAQTSCRLWKD